MPKKSENPHVCLVCWDTGVAADRAKLLEKAGFRIAVVSESMSGWISYFRDLALDAVVFDLDKLPSHSRQVAMHLRDSKSMRHLPFVFLGGSPDKVARTRADLPYAAFASWDDPGEIIRKAIAAPIVKPAQISRRPLGRDLATKLGVKDGNPVVLWGDTDFLAELLADAAECVPFHGRLQPRSLCLCVTRSADELETVFDTMTHAYTDKSLLWIIHPKQTSRYRTDFNQNDVRAMGISHGWVDFKVCAVDHDWSGLAFALRRATKPLKP